MYRKWLFLVIILVLLTGCTRIEATDDDYIGTINNLLSYNNNYVNSASVGYEYYLPKGLKLLENKDYNQIFKYNDDYLYLHVDIVSYYYKKVLNFYVQASDHYYYSNIGDKGYILIDKENNDRYFVKLLYNYAKIEFYVDSINLNKMISYSMIILNSIRYNDLSIESILNDSDVSSSEINYEIEGPNNDGKFSQYLEEYIMEDEKEKLPDE